MGVCVNTSTICLVPGEAMAELKVCAGGLSLSLQLCVCL